jgi:hypothetical protein
MIKMQCETNKTLRVRLRDYEVGYQLECDVTHEA